MPTFSRFIEKDGMREFVSPANPAESENDPKVKAAQIEDDLKITPFSSHSRKNLN